MKNISTDLKFDSSEFSSFNSTNQFNFVFSPEKEFLSEFDYSFSSNFFEETKMILIELNKAIQITNPEEKNLIFNKKKSDIIKKSENLKVFQELKELFQGKSVTFYNRDLGNNFMNFNKFYKRKTVPIKVLYPEENDSVSTANETAEQKKKEDEKIFNNFNNNNLNNFNFNSNFNNNLNSNFK